MKKILTIALAVVMLAATFAVPAFAQQTNVSVEAAKFTKAPEFDGVISEEEWGPITITVKGSEAATKEDEEVNQFNTYMEFETEDIKEAMSYDLWLRWDADYFYIGAFVRDPDGFSCPNGGENIWNGDTLQTRIDPWGPGSAMLKKNPDWNYLNDAWDFAKMNFDGNEKKAWLNPDKIINAGFGLVKGLQPQAFDMCTGVGAVMEGTDVAIATVDTGDGENTFTCETTYEIRIPWTTICRDCADSGFTVAEGSVLGMTLGVLNSNGANFNALLTWGSGIFGGQAKNARKTCGGSNAVTLAATEVAPADSFPKATEEVTTEEVTEAPAQTQKTDDKSDATEAATKKDAGPVDIDVDKGGDGLSTGAIIGIIAAAVVVVAVIVIAVVASKKKKK